MKIDPVVSVCQTVPIVEISGEREKEKSTTTRADDKPVDNNAASTITAKENTTNVSASISSTKNVQQKSDQVQAEKPENEHERDQPQPSNSHLQRTTSERPSKKGQSNPTIRSTTTDNEASNQDEEKANTQPDKKQTATSIPSKYVPSSRQQKIEQEASPQQPNKKKISKTEEQQVPKKQKENEKEKLTETASLKKDDARQSQQVLDDKPSKEKQQLQQKKDGAEKENEQSKPQQNVTSPASHKHILSTKNSPSPQALKSISSLPPLSSSSLPTPASPSSIATTALALASKVHSSSSSSITDASIISRSQLPSQSLDLDSFKSLVQPSSSTPISHDTQHLLPYPPHTLQSLPSQTISQPPLNNYFSNTVSMPPTTLSLYPPHLRPETFPRDLHHNLSTTQSDLQSTSRWVCLFVLL